MMLNMSSNFEGYHQSRSDEGFGGGSFDDQNRHGKESIHSGQFMVSHFEAEEAQDDDDDSEIKMPDPDDPNLSKQDEVNSCMEVQLYVPRKAVEYGSPSVVTSHLEIETSLTKLFKCMNLAYSQKLTSPKWNHFKGVRLRWKDKIRLNNVIWRCWHMQFIMKKRTPVCQFASPLDVDVHSNPQSVVLEGKYWKRQLDVIKAEYRKWRRNFKSKATGCLIYDTRSEFDFLEWSPLTGDRNLMLTDDWTTDTLFSAINVPFPFPDPREIARGAGIADFIQPSLGPLQPNLEDIDVTFQELLQSTRLPPVPEEGTDDILKSVEYNFPAIMGNEEMDSSNAIDVDSDNTGAASRVPTMTELEDANMLELNLLQSSMADVRDNNNVALMTNSDYSNALLQLGQNKSNVMNTFPINTEPTTSQMGGFPGKSIMKGRVSKPLQRPFRREPHNYDKAQPTMHQTNIYQQMLAEQQQQQQQLQPQQQSTNLQFATQQYTSVPAAVASPTQMSNNRNFLMQTTTTNQMLNMPPNSTNQQATMVKSYSVPQTLPMATHPKLDTAQTEILSMFNLSSTPDHQQQPQQPYKSSIGHSTSSMSNAGGASYKPYPSTTQLLKKPASSANYLTVRSSSNHAISYVPEQQSTTSSQQPIAPKEMFRSNSLPLNTSLIKLESKANDNFAVPKYHAKTHKSRSRSNSIQQNATNLQIIPQMQSATSDPMLNSTLAQLLTTNSNRLSNKQSSSTSAISSVITQNLPPSGFSKPYVQLQPSSSGMQAQTAQQIKSNLSSKTVSPKKASSLPLPPAPIMMHSPPGSKQVMSFPPTLSAHSSPQTATLSPESYHDQDSPLSPTQSSSGLKYPRENQRRAGHIHAEQKRRYNIKNGFDMLHSLIPQLQQNPNAKLSKAAMLQKGAEYIKQLRNERSSLHEKMDALRKERDSLNNSLSHLHSILPANGAPVSRQRTERVKQLYEQYVNYRTMQNWKFWILGLILEPLLNSYTTTVSIASMEELRRTALLWVDQHCSLIDLRPAVSNKLRYLSMTTDILSDPPSTLQEEVSKALNNTTQHPNLNGS